MGRKLTNEGFLQKLKDLGRNDLEPLEEYAGTHTKIKFKCTKPECGNEWYMEPNCVISMGQGCPRCGALKNADANRLSQTEFEDKIKQLNPNKCIGCRLCSYICPSKIDLRKYISNAKKVINDEN